MKRRDFIKLSTLLGASIFLPNMTFAKEFKIEDIDFSSSIYSQNNAQTIIINMYGGASQLSGNITNIDTIEKYSQSSYYNYFRGITKTKNGCWQEAGGKYMEELLSQGDMTLYRCCYSAIREANSNKSHGKCTEQNQKGSFDTSGGGIVTNLATVLEANGVIDENTLMPFVTMDGDSQFYAEGNKPLKSFLKPIGIDESFDNPYLREIWTVRKWYYYTEQERTHKNYYASDEEGGFEPKFNKDMDSMAQSYNRNGKIKEAFSKREKLASFIENIKKAQTPDLGDDAYIENNNFAKKVEAAIKLLDKNPDTKVITIGTGGLGSWDDHNVARDYVPRMEALFKTMKSAMAHLKAIGKDGKINILIFAEFGRNVNLNSANGWDHGNLQNFYVLGGKNYFTHKGVVGETVVDVTGQLNRLWLKPKSGTYWFEPISIASTIYKLYGIENPDILTGGNFESVNVLS